MGSAALGGDAAPRTEGPLDSVSIRGLIASLFCLTGGTALATEIVLSRLLTYVFGSSHLATATVLAAYMAGLSLGAYLFGGLASRLRRPLRAYAALELGVGLFVTLVPSLHELFSAIGLQAGRLLWDRPDLLVPLRFLLSFGFVLLPTTLMGGTLPVLVSAFGGPGAIERRLPLLYATNTLGAALGSLLAAYVVIPALGLDGTLFASALVNLAVALTGFALSWRFEDGGNALPDGLAATQPPPGPPGVTTDPPAEVLPDRLVPELALLQGGLAFVLEVTWTHMIGTVIGVTVYAFALMLAAVLLGIGLGSLAIPALKRSLGLEELPLFVWSELALAAGILGPLFLWDRFPQVITLALSQRAEWPFAAREAVRFAFALCLLLPASLPLGVALPALTASGSASGRSPGELVGRVFAANTVGAILGSVGCGFGLLGRVASSTIFRAAAGAAVLMALVAAVSTRCPPPWRERWRKARPLLFAAAFLALVAAAFPGWNRHRLIAGSHYYWEAWRPERRPPDEIVFFGEDAQSGFITVERAANGTRTLKTNGKYEGSDAPLEFQDHLALIGALYLKGFDRAALVGLGPGRTLALLHALPFRRIEVAEFSPAIVAAARSQFPGLVGGALADHARVRLVQDDGRNYLQVAPPGYDYVVVAITGAAFAGVGNIYTREFFTAVSSHLSQRGVFMLWLQLHHVGQREVRSVLLTLRRVFPSVHFYATPGGDHGYLVASRSPLSIDPRLAQRFSRLPRIAALLEASRLRSLLELTSLNIFSSDQELARYLSPWPGVPPPRLLTDFNPAFEYATPYGLAGPPGGLDLQPFSAKALPAFEPPLSPGEQAGFEGLRLLAAGEQAAALELFERSDQLLGQPVWADWIRELRRIRDSQAPAS